MNENNIKLKKDQEDFLISWENFTKNNTFVQEPQLRFKDGILLIYESIYFQLENIKDIELNKRLICTLYQFEKFMAKGRFVSILYKAIQSGANLLTMTLEEFNTLISYNDKDILIQLSKSRYINDDVAIKLIQPIYLVLDSLLDNSIISYHIRENIFEYMIKLNSKTFNDLIQKHQQYLQN